MTINITVIINVTANRRINNFPSHIKFYRLLNTGVLLCDTAERIAKINFKKTKSRNSTK